VARKDPVTPGLRYTLMSRDRGCVGPQIGMPGLCGSQFGSGGRVILEVDHVNSAGFGKRGPSTEGNCVILCGYHHRLKTEASKTWRPVLNNYLEKYNG